MKINLGLFFLLSIFLNLATAGVKEVGNGGVGVLCKKSFQKPLELFDLYEGRILQNLTPLESSLSFSDLAMSYSQQLDESIFGTDSGDKSFKTKINKVLSMLKFLPSGVGLNSTNDVGNIIYPKDCTLVQILNFKNDGYIYVDSDLWNQLSEIDKAAAILHEVIYQYFRNPLYRQSLGDGDINSLRARRVVALLMAGKKLERVDQSEIQDNTQKQWMCRSLHNIIEAGLPSTQFLVIPMADGNNRIQFSVLNGHPMLTSAALYFQGSFQKIGIQDYVQSLVDWDIQVQILSTSYIKSRFIMTIIDGNEEKNEALECSQEL